MFKKTKVREILELLNKGLSGSRLWITLMYAKSLKESELRKCFFGRSIVPGVMKKAQIIAVIQRLLQDNT